MNTTQLNHTIVVALTVLIVPTLIILILSEGGVTREGVMLCVCLVSLVLSGAVLDAVRAIKKRGEQ